MPDMSRTQLRRAPAPPLTARTPWRRDSEFSHKGCTIRCVAEGVAELKRWRVKGRLLRTPDEAMDVVEGKA